MPTTNSLTTSYAGEFAGQYISAALLSGNTLSQGAVSIKPNIKFKETIKTLSTDDVIKDASCDFDPTSTLTIGERILQPTEQQVNLQLCKADFRSDWEAIQMGFSAHDNLPSSFSDYLIGYVASKVAEKTEENIWRGAAANNGEFDGFTTALAADSDVVDVSGTTVTSANVVTELGKIVDAIPSAVYGKEDMRIYISQNIARAYVRALGGFAALGNTNTYNNNAGVGDQGTMWYSMGQDLAFDGVKLFVANGLADNKAVAAQSSNLYFGTGLLSDHNEVKVIDMADIDGSQNVRIVMRFTAGVLHGIGSDIVLYS